jgi:mono/diheme cytochrome c family protein
MNTRMLIALALVTPAIALAQAASAAGGSPPYKVVDGTKVDPATMEGFRTWRAAACDRCHGANQEGMVGPSLIDSLKKLSKDDFRKVVLEGRLEKGMPAFKTSEQVSKHVDDLYAYLKGRSDGAIKQAKVQPIQQ